MAFINPAMNYMQPVMSPVMSPVMNPVMNPMMPQINPMMNTRSLVKTLTTQQPEMPFVPTVDFTYSRPSIALVENLNADPDVHKKVTKYFYYKVLDKWIYDEMMSVLSYFKVDGGKKVSYVNKLDDYNKDAAMKYSQEQVDAIIDFIEDSLFTKKMVNSILHQFVSESGVNWYDLPHQEGVVREIISKKLKHKIRKHIAGKEK